MLDILTKFDAVLWDFDGVLMNSNPVRDRGFAETLAGFPKEQVKALLDFHQANGGLSRYVKFRYFFETIRQETVTDQHVREWAQRFSGVVKSLLFNKGLLIDETLDWVRQHYLHQPMFIVSGSDQEELREVCSYHGIGCYFRDIFGSPTPKKQLVASLIQNYRYAAGNCVLVGDSINDYEAAEMNGLCFLPYNNPALLSFNTCG